MLDYLNHRVIAMANPLQLRFEWYVSKCNSVCRNRLYFSCDKYKSWKKEKKFFCLLNNLRAKKIKIFILHIIRLILTKDLQLNSAK